MIHYQRLASRNVARFPGSVAADVSVVERSTLRSFLWATRTQGWRFLVFTCGWRLLVLTCGRCLLVLTCGWRLHVPPKGEAGGV